MCTFIHDRAVYPIIIKNKGKSYLTLHYYTEQSDSVLHADKVVYFRSAEEMELFCEEHKLTISDDIYEYDFDAPISNPIDFERILNNWNLLNTVVGIFGMYFEGDCKKYTPVYELLFRLNTPIEPIPPTYRLSEKYYRQILRVFKKKDRILDKFSLFCDH